MERDGIQSARVAALCIFATRRKVERVAVLRLQEMMPLQYLYTMALEQDIKNSVASRKTSELLQNRCYQVRFRPKVPPALQRRGSMS